MGMLLLEGGAEFGGRMSEPDRRAMELAGGADAAIAILPTAAAPDHNDQHAGGNGLRWFRSLGGKNAEVIPVIDRASADDEGLATRIRQAHFIYMLGGFPGYVVETLIGSRAWKAALAAYADGAVLGGSSAGAMVLCEHLYDPKRGGAAPGLNMIPNACVLPHHNAFGRGWAPQLAQALPNAVLIGIDERTGMLGAPGGEWTVYGAGKVTLYIRGGTQSYAGGQSFRLPESREVAAR